ncbi:immunoglobulin superfamily member 3-like [Stigmatopora argus]
MPSFDLWIVCLFLSMATFLHLGNASALTWVQAGPLYRTAGSHLSISCNVSGFAVVTSRMEFEFRVAKPTNPSFVLNVISTADPDFGYAQYRTRGPGVALTHMLPNSVLFEIKSLQKDDEGEYECTVINPKHTDYDGIYSVKTTVKVIDDSLSVSSDVLASLNYNQGELLALTCQAFSSTKQHTHLSVGWYLQKEGDAESRLILSLDRDFTLRPGPEFLGRYQSDQVRLDKAGDTLYRLTIARLEPSDVGRIYCQAQEWIEDPDLSWFSLTQKTATKTMLNVKSKESAPDKVSLVVKLSARQISLQEGEELLLTCSVDTHEPEERSFTVAWLRQGAELAKMGPTGVLSVTSENSRRETLGELRATRIRDGDHRLILQYVSAEDQGEYMCRVWPQESGQHGIPVQGQDSNSLQVSVSAPASEMLLEMQQSVHLNEGDKLKLACKVQGYKGQLSVTWQRKVQQMSTFSNIISLSQEGVVEETADDVATRISASRPSKDVFVLEIDEITVADSGMYQCMVSAWNTRSKSSRFVTTAITVAPTELLVEVNLISRNSVVTIGDNVELICRIKGPHFGITLTWSLKRASSPVETILTMSSNGAVSWSGEQQRYHLRVSNAPNERIYYLIINGASYKEMGSYQCQVSIFQKSIYKMLLPSNQLMVLVQRPVSDLILTPTPDLTGNINGDISIQCSVVSSRSGSSHFAVTWFLQQETQNVTILKWDRDSSVTKDNGQRFSMQQTKGPNFQLTIRDSQTSDGGFYVCEVVEWLKDPHGEWYPLQAVAGRIQLTLIQPGDSLHLDRKEQQVIAKEGDKVQLKCDLISDASSKTCFYTVTWFYSRLGSFPINAQLLELNHLGLLRYSDRKDLQGMQGRIRLSRPNRSSFGLEIQSVHQVDSGKYRCRVEQYQLSTGGKMERTGSADGNSIAVSVNSPDIKLSLVKQELELNVSTSQEFTIHCDITQQSSLESKFQVTWFWKEKPESQQRAIFTFYPNSTLRSYSNSTLRHIWFASTERLRFAHALPNQFSLTVFKPSLSHSGFYFCEVEEWLPSLADGWRKAAVETSGFSNISVYSQGKSESRSDCPLATWIGLLVAVVVLVLCLCLLLLLVLRLKKRQAKTSRDKQEQSLWTEHFQLDTEGNK